MVKKVVEINSLAGIEYHGSSGITQSCLQALVRIIQYGQTINRAILISKTDGRFGTHSFLLDVDDKCQIVIQTGFSSGYGGEGPTGLSTALKLLIRHKVDVDEKEVDQDLMNRIEHSALLNSDLELLENKRPVRPVRYYDYIFGYDFHEIDHSSLNRLFPEVLPIALIDSRIMDLALDFERNPDIAVISAYRRLEDIVREDTGLKDESGKRLFAKAFQGEKSLFYWNGLGQSEVDGRAQLFVGVYMACRNPRAHKEPEDCLHSAMREFLLVNELFLLQGSAIKREQIEPGLEK